MLKKQSKACDNLMKEITSSSSLETRAISRIVKISYKNGFITGKAMNKYIGLIDFNSYSIKCKIYFGPLVVGENTNLHNIKKNDYLFGTVTTTAHNKRYYSYCRPSNDLSQLLSASMNIHTYRKQSSSIANDTFRFCAALLMSDYNYILDTIKTKSKQQQQNYHSLALELALFLQSERLFLQYQHLMVYHKINHTFGQIEYASLEQFFQRCRKRSEDQDSLFFNKSVL
tara:strand:+ start:3892 stop:4575 length:684 start_codon:yes stop_codon:yes gene_type:complete